MKIEQGGPPFEQIARHVQEQIANGDLSPGDPVPSEREMRAEWDVSKATANKALALLKSWGSVETRVGSRTTVAASSAGVPISGPREHSARVRRGAFIYADGERSEVYDTGVLSTGVVGSSVLQAVGLPTPDPSMPSETTQIIKRSRRMYRGDELRAICTTWFPWFLIAQQPGGQDVIDALVAFEKVPGRSTTRLVADLYGQDFTHETNRVGVRPAPTDVAMELHLEPGRPVLWVLTTRYAGEYVIEADEWFRTDDVVLDGTVVTV